MRKNANISSIMRNRCSSLHDNPGHRLSKNLQVERSIHGFGNSGERGKILARENNKLGI